MDRLSNDRLYAVASLSEIRDQFPALGRTLAGAKVAYFDGPGGTQVSKRVVEAMSDYLYHHNANTCWPYPSSTETDAMIAAARATLADFVNAAPAEIVFGPNMTTLTFHLSRALSHSYEPGDEILVTELDHHANIDPWRTLEKERGLTIRQVRMLPATGQIDWDDFGRQLNRRTKLVAIGAASNALGTITDVRRAADMAHNMGAQVFVDAVHYAPHELVDVRAMDCEFLACSAYKFYGPHLGLLYGRHDLLGSIDFPRLQPAPAEAPDRAETGTQNHEGIAGAAAAIDFLASLAPGRTRREKLSGSFAELKRRGQQLMERTWKGLSAIPRVKTYGPPPDQPRTPTIVFAVEGISSTEVARRLGEQGLFLSSGDFYAATVIERLGLKGNGLIRAGCACYTSEEEVERLLHEVRAIAAGN